MPSPVLFRVSAHVLCAQLGFRSISPLHVVNDVAEAVAVASRVRFSELVRAKKHEAERESTRVINVEESDTDAHEEVAEEVDSSSAM
mgnify:CR=1 FL=1